MTSDGYRVPPNITRLPTDHQPTGIDGYPQGARVGRVRECAVLGCTGCQESLSVLSRYVGGLSRDGEHRSLEAYND